MRTVLLLMVALAALGECQGSSKYHSRVKKDLLLRSKRRWVLNTIELEEEMNVKYPYKISTMHNDQTEGRTFKFSISGEGADDGVFTIDGKTGDVFVHRAVDREEKAYYHITFDVWDQTTNSRIDRELGFDVEVKDINDNAPRFINLPKSANVNENTDPGFLPVSLEYMDADKEKTENSTVIVSVTSQSPAEPKIMVQGINEGLAQLTFEGCFDYDKAKQYKVVVTAKDMGKPPLSGSATIVLNIIDTNSHQPKFKKREYQIEAVEMIKYDSLLRIEVEDKDTPNTEGWLAEYFFISGNEEKIFDIKRDPKTNDGILQIVKEKNYDHHTVENLKIGVKNVQPFAACKNNKLIKDPNAGLDSINITVTMTDTNDAPVFDKYTEDVYQKEEMEPGQVLYTPKVQDPDSTNIRFVLVEDPADWVTLDEKTGKITSVKKMDRESPFVDKDNIYKVVIAAIDNGDPPATSTCTVKVHLADINDNTPKLVNSSVIFCIDRERTIPVPVIDTDVEPHNGPYIFEFGDKTLKEKWKLEPSHGEVGGLTAQKELPHGSYSVLLEIQDQQNLIGHETLQVEVCDCGKSDVCVAKRAQPLSTVLSSAAIGLIIFGVLLFLLLLLLITCKKGEIEFKYMEDNTGTQSLTQYNEEGGAAECKSELNSYLKLINGDTVTDDIKPGYVTKTEATSEWMQHLVEHNSSSHLTNSQMNSHMNTMGSTNNKYYGGSEMLNRRATWNSRRSLNQRKSVFKRSLSTVTNHRVLDTLMRNLNQLNYDDQEYGPKIYEEEGLDTRCQSLDELSLDIKEEDLKFLDDLGPKFKTLGEKCQSNKTTYETKNMQL